MKKSIYLFALMALVVFSSCLNNDDDVQKTTYGVTLNCRTISGDKVAFTQNTGALEVDNINNTIQITCSYKDNSGQFHVFNSPTMSLTTASANTYQFKSNDASGLYGYWDLETTVLWFTFTADPSTTVVCSTHLQYAYVTTVISSDGHAPFSHNKTAYEFILNNEGKKCTMRLYNFVEDFSGAVKDGGIQYDDVTLTPTTVGYTVTADTIAPKSGTITITDLNIKLDNQGRAINGSFKTGDKTYTVSGNLFPAQ